MRGCSETAISARGFALFRLALGVYLSFHFAALVPCAGELFGPAGVAPDPGRQPAAFFPNLLSALDSELGATLFCVALSALAWLFALGVARPWLALLLWYGWACLLGRNVLILNPGIPYVGWLLLACALVPRGEALRAAWCRADWRMQPLLHRGAWCLLALGYTVSGLHKLGAVSWRDGSALQHVLSLPLVRSWELTVWLQAAPEPLLAALSWGALALEILCLPLALSSRTRPWIWLALVGMQLGILLCLDFADLTGGMLLMHAFTFDRRWWRGAPLEGQRAVMGGPYPGWTQRLGGGGGREARTAGGRESRVVRARSRTRVSSFSRCSS